MKNNLSDYRKELKISQDELAKKMCVSRQTISSLEKDRYNPSIVLAMKLAKYFNVTVEELFIYEEGDDDVKK
ncbi:helix-turn-helix transcriptional regulator [Vagococcus intermedius]|uniref:Helix-turn-helix transcriptional regulator n=1 Tax=Vagococcus intermedius TaxID=2991418 RepID=A0AAF0I4B0_9ENTE|nr:helix-turn-helix transcriptional regulator [Vagococcus intermedius]WEG72403.1 helix-turn-helix transcriptional regulator [Vagococcus intermedius]WEG74491.1 helix-turn-helix transcriptional regulator [Vagococcus intermedius]